MGLITAPLGDAGTSDMDLDAIPSTVGERGDPLGTLRQIGSATSRSIAEYGTSDEFGRQVSAPEPMVDPRTLQKKWGIDSATPGNSLTFDAPLPESVAIDMNQAKREEIARKDASARSPGGVGSALADFGYGMLDPVGIAASVLPVFGEARMGALAGRLGIDLGESLAGRTALRAATGAVDATAANVPLVGLRYGLSQQQQADYTMSDAARDLAYGSVLGGLLHPALGAVGDLLGRRAPVAEPGESDAGPLHGTDPLAEAAAASPEMRAVDADPHAHAAAMQASVAAVAEDRPVDVSPIVESAAAQRGLDLPAEAPPAPESTTYPVFTPGGQRIEARPEIVPLASLLASHDADGRINPDYPTADGLQPRDRSNVASQAQIRDIAANLQPARLGPSPEAGTGAPIVSPEGVVESGNGRVAALRTMYSDAGLSERATAYRQWLMSQGHDIDGVENPVLIGRRTTEFAAGDTTRFARGANERATLGMNASEQARADSGRAGVALDQWRGGDVGAASNRDFVRAFMAQLPAEERGPMLLPSGGLSSEGVRRIQGAVLAHAYGDVLGPTLSRMLNGDAEGMKAVAGALSDSAGVWGQMRLAASQGRIPSALDITRSLGDAIQALEHARSIGRPVAELLAQADLDRSPLSPQSEALLRLMFHDGAMRKPVARTRFAAILEDYAAESLKVQPGADMFGAEPASAGDILGAVSRGQASSEQAAMAFSSLARERAAGEPAPEDAATLKQADQAASLVTKPGALPPEITRAIQAAQADIDRARAAGVLRPEDETEMVAANDAEQASASRQQGLLQAGACVARGLG